MMRKTLSVLLACALLFSLVLPTQLVYARTISDLEAYQNYIINMDYELQYDGRTYSLYYLIDNKVSEPNDSNSSILFFNKSTGNLVTTKNTLDALTRMYILAKTQDDYLRMVEIAEWSTPFIVLGTEIWRQLGESLVDGVVGAYIKKKPPTEALRKISQQLVKDQVENLKNPQMVLMLWALTKYYGEIKPNLDYPYGPRGISVIEENGKKIAKMNSGTARVTHAYSRFINGYFEYVEFLHALEELGLALEPSFKAVLTETLNVMYLGTMSALTEHDVTITKSGIEKAFKDIYKTLKELDITLVLDPETVINIEGPDAVEFVRTMDNFISELYQYERRVNAQVKQMNVDIDSWATNVSERRKNFETNIILTHRVRELENPANLVGKWIITYLDRNNTNDLYIHSYDSETGKITGYLEGDRANYDVAGHFDKQHYIVHLETMNATYEDVLKILSGDPNIPEKHLESHAQQLYEQREAITRTMEFPYVNEGRTPVYASGTYWSHKYDRKKNKINITSHIPMTDQFTLHKDQPEPRSVAAKPTLSTVIVDGKQVSFEAYTIDGYNYFKLRDLAQALNGSFRNFDIDWDEEREAIMLYPKSRYTPVGNELQQSGISYIVMVKPNYPLIQIYNSPVSLEAYKIRGNNYFKLRDIAKLFDFSVEWNGELNQIEIDTNSLYAE